MRDSPRARVPSRCCSAAPSYVLRSPDANDTPFPEVLSRYSEVGQSQGWLLHPNTDLHIENAYYREGAPKHGIADFIGTEKAVYQVRPKSLHLISVESGCGARATPGGSTAGAGVDWSGAIALSLLSIFLPNCVSAEGGCARSRSARGKFDGRVGRPGRAAEDRPGCGLRRGHRRTVLYFPKHARWRSKSRSWSTGPRAP